MYLKQIIANGFKSFADKINIDFENGITGIVGPNGSGKSNIVDAVRWVLGEQSVKSLRGDGSMTDIIFSGSKSRNPSNYASVTLIFDNSDNHLKIEYKEVSIKRVVYRSGENEYYLNNSKCRLKDILDLFIDSGSGRESFNIISQGDIANILSSKPEERRVIFESAAGILKYKRRKEDAIKKLDRTHDNIDRVNDIINEIETQLEPLKEQSEKAKKFVDAKGELESIEVSLIANDIDNLNNESIKIKENIENLKKDILDNETSLNLKYSNVEKEKLEYSKLSTISSELQNKLIEQTEIVERLNSEKNIIGERKKYEVEDIKLHNNIVELKEQQLTLRNKIDSTNKDIENIEEELNKLNNELDKNKELLNNINSDIEYNSDLLNSKIKEQTNLEYKINTLKNNIDSNSDLSYSVKSVLNNKSLKGIHGVIGKLISFDEKYTITIDTALGYSSQFIVCDDESSASSAIHYLKSNNLGRATFFPLNIIEKKRIDSDTMNLIFNEKGYVDIASNLVQYNNKYENIILNQLGNIIVAKDIDSANKISKLINYKYRIVTLEGELLNVGGSITGGTSKRNSSVLLDKMELEKSNNLYNTLSKSIEEIENKLDKLNENKRLSNIKYNEINNKLIYEQQIINTKYSIKKDYNFNLEKIEKDLNSTKNILENNISKEEDEILEKYFNAISIKESIQKDIERNNKLIDSYNDKITEMEHDIRILNQAFNTKQKDLKDYEIKLNRIDVKLDSLLQTLNEEYNLTFERAKKDYVLVLEESIARNKVIELRNIIKELGIVNLGAIEEYDRISKRYDFLNNQKSDLYKAENTLLDIIKEMDVVMKDNFINTFKSIQIEFKTIFKELFSGGTADLKLTDPNNILQTGIDIIALPPGKNLQHISLLSGGEKALTAIAILFSILKVRPVPFCILDEVEAPLDEVNVSNFGNFLKKFENNTQFIVITHKKKTMEYTDVLYGITMQESGVSKLVSVKLNDIK